MAIFRNCIFFESTKWANRVRNGRVGCSLGEVEYVGTRVSKLMFAMRYLV